MRSAYRAAVHATGQLPRTRTDAAEPAAAVAHFWLAPVYLDMPPIPEAFQDLFETQTLAHVATMLPNGLPHVTPVWIDYDPERDHVLFNTARGRRKERNIQANPAVGVSMCDPENPYRYCSAWGEVVGTTEEGAVEHIDELARRYMDVEEYPYKDANEGARVIVRIEPDEVVTGQ